MSCPNCLGRRLVTAEGRLQAEASLCPRCVGVCSTCHGEGYVYETDAQGYEVARVCSCQELERRAARFNAAQIPARYHNASLFNFEERLDHHQEIVEYLDTWLQEFYSGCEGLLFVGATGTGKTHLLCALLRHVTLQMGVAARFVDFFHLLARIREAYSGGSSEMALLGPLMDVPLLAIDELGKGKPGDWERGVLDQLISHRYNQQLTTLFTTNHPLPRAGAEGGARELPDRLSWNSIEDLERLKGLPSLDERVGIRIYSRIREVCRPILLAGAEDIRLSQWAPDPLGGS